ncbi:MAG: OadG family transporter subunit [Eubacteriales bacterium]|nr:OadG family transporter subunit [Eubacteriales bacterium]
MLYAVSAVKENVMKSLEIMGYGVLAVFIVIAILIILVKLMQYIEKRIAKNKGKEGYKPLKDKLKEKYEAKKGARDEKRIQTSDENKPE